MRALLATVLVSLLIFAGCLRPVSEDAPAPVTSPALVFDPDWAERAIEKLPGHNHRDPLQHQGRSTPNFETLAWNPLITDYSGKTGGGHLCGDVAERPQRRLAVTHSFVSDVAFVIIDVTDPKVPIKIGEYVLTNTHVYDLGITPDQRYVLLATDLGGQGEDPKASVPSPSYFEDACTGERHYFAGPETLAPLWEGVVSVDIRNPKQPVMADYLFLGGGHSIQIRNLLERTLALVTTASFSLIEVRSDGKLVPVSSFLDCKDPIVGPVDMPVCSYHDGYLQRHPTTGQALAYLANGGTMEVFRIDDPARPVRIGGWNDWASLGEVSPSFLHEILPMEELWEGRHYTFAGEECVGKPAKTPTCLIVLLDTTDPIRPVPVGTWTLPVTPQWDSGLMYSLHYIGYSNGTLFVTNYHGGLWAVDVSTPEARKTMPTIGVFIPDKVSPKPIGRPTSYDMTPAVLDVNPLSDGSLITWDHTSGLYTLRFDASQPAPAPTPWKFK